MNESVRMVPRHEEVKDAPALGMSLQVDLGLGRTATLQTFVASDAPQRTVNEMLDKLTRAGDRQRAHYRLEELHRAIELEQHEHDLMVENITTAKATFNAEQEKRIAEVARQQALLTNFERARVEVRSEGRRNPKPLAGADLANVERVKTGVEAAKQAVLDWDMQYPVDCANREASLATHVKAIARLQRDIARCQEIEKAGLEG